MGGTDAPVRPELGPVPTIFLRRGNSFDHSYIERTSGVAKTAAATITEENAMPTRVPRSAAMPDDSVPPTRLPASAALTALIGGQEAS